jgi:tetratricopeptide (TPR) repeat protein
MKGAAYDELGKYNEAIDAYKNLIVLDPYDSTNQATRDVIERD